MSRCTRITAKCRIAKLQNCITIIKTMQLRCLFFWYKYTYEYASICLLVPSFRCDITSTFSAYNYAHPSATLAEIISYSALDDSSNCIHISDTADVNYMRQQCSNSKLRCFLWDFPYSSRQWTTTKYLGLKRNKNKNFLFKAERRGCVYVLIEKLMR